VGAPGLGSGCH